MPRTAAGECYAGEVLQSLQRDGCDCRATLCRGHGLRSTVESIRTTVALTGVDPSDFSFVSQTANHMAELFRTQRRVEFRDTDAAGIVHFSVFLVWMEQTEHAALRQLGISVLPTGAPPVITWPRVSVRTDFIAPARFEDVLDVELRVEQLGTKSVTYGVEFRRGDQLLARGQSTVVCCEHNAAGQLKSIAIPPALADQLRHYLVTPAAP